MLSTPDILRTLLPTQLRFLIAKEVSSWKKNSPGLWTERVTAAFSRNKGWVHQTCNSRTGSFHPFLNLPSNCPLTRRVQGSTESDCCRAGCTCPSFAESSVSYVTLSCTIFSRLSHPSFFDLKRQKTVDFIFSIGQMTFLFPSHVSQDYFN